MDETLLTLEVGVSEINTRVRSLDANRLGKLESGVDVKKIAKIFHNFSTFLSFSPRVWM